MKRDEPFNVLRDPNSWSNAPRAEAIAFSLFGSGFASAAAFSATTAGLLATTAVSVGLSLVTSWAVSALTPAPPTPKQSILVNSRDPAAPQEFVYGQVRKGGITTYYETTRKGSVLYQIITVAAHEVESIDAIYINDKEVTLSEDGYDNGDREGAGWVTDAEWTDDSTKHEIRLFYHLGDQTSITDTFANSSTETLDSVFFDTGASDEDSNNFGGSGQPTEASFVGNNIAYIFVRYSFNSSVFSKGLPLVTCRLKGRKVFDPRDSSTTYSNNAALCIRDFLTSSYGLDDPEVDDTVFSAAANNCDEIVDLDGGGTESRFTLNGVVRANQSYGDVLNQMVTSCAGTLFWGAGKWKLTVGVYNAPTKVLTLDDLRSNISLQTRTNLRDQFNRVQGTFLDKDNRYLVADYPPIESTAFLAQDGDVEQSLDFDLPFTTSSATAQRLAKMTLFRGREQMVFAADFGLNAFDVEVGEIIALTVDRYGWSEREFEVIGWNFNSSSEGGELQISLTLRETSEDAFDWNAEESEIISNDTDLEFTLDPVANLTATNNGTVGADGKYLNRILVDWDSTQGARGYEVEWTVNDYVDYSLNGGVVEASDIVTARDQLVYDAFIEVLYRQPGQDGFDYYTTGAGSSLTDPQLRDDLADSAEKRSLTFSGVTVRNPTTEFNITPVIDNVIYFIRVRAFNGIGNFSEYNAVNFTTIPDQSIPSAPENLTATSGLGTVKLAWDKVTTNVDASTANDIALYGIYRDTSTSPTTLVDTTAGEGWSDVALLEDTEYFYRVTAIDATGNESDYSNNANATTGASTVDSKTVSGTVYYQILQASQPATPSATSFSKSTGSFSGLTSNWSRTQPSVDITDTSVREWSSQFVATFEGSNTTTTDITFTAPDGAIQVTDDIESDNYSSGSAGWRIERDTGDAEFNNVTVRGVIETTSASSYLSTFGAGTTGVRLGSGAPGQASGRIATFTSDTQANAGVIIENKTGCAAWVYKTGSGGIGIDNFALYVQNTSSTSGTAAARFFTNSEGYVELGTVDGYGVHVTTDSDKGVLSELNSNTLGKDAGKFRNTNSGGDVALGGPSVAGGWGVDVPTASQQGVRARINGTTANKDAGFFENSGTGGGWAIIGRSDANNGYAVDCREGDIRLRDGTTQPFTGSHDGLLSKIETIEVGDIVCDSETVYTSINDSITKVVRSSTSNDKTCLGVYSKTVNNFDITLLEGDGYEVDYYHVIVNSVGEGAINVCGENGDIAAGDLIVTSSTPGKGMKQSDDIVRSYTVAKARGSVTFSSSSDIKMIACIYLCG